MNREKSPPAATPGGKVNALSAASTAAIMTHPADTLRALLSSDGDQAEVDQTPGEGGCTPRCPWCHGWPAW